MGNPQATRQRLVATHWLAGAPLDDLGLVVAPSDNAKIMSREATLVGWVRRPTSALTQYLQSDHLCCSGRLSRRPPRKGYQWTGRWQSVRCVSAPSWV